MWPFKRRIKDPVEGQAQVVSSTGVGDGSPVYASCRMQLVVQAPGIPAFHTEHKQLCPTKKWPYPGTTVPVSISRKNPHRLRIDFDRMTTTEDRARATAAEQAARLRGEPPSNESLGIVDVSTTTNVEWVGGGPEDLSPEQRDRVEDLLGIDVDGDGVVGTGGRASGTPSAASAGGPAPAGGDRIAKLERLTRLRDTGALTPEEFEAEKARLLGS